MRDAGGIYQGKDGRGYLAVYNFNNDVFRMLPPDFKVEPIAHFSYTFGKKEGGVDVFRLLPGAIPKDMAKIVTGVRPFREGYEIIKDTERKKRRLYVSPSDLENIREKHNIHVQILGNISQEMQKEIINSTNTDIFEFCEGIEAKVKETPTTLLVDKIISKTKIRYINPTRVLTPGKQDFVPTCYLEANIDFGQGCVSNWVPGDNPSFDGEYFEDYYLYKWGGCDYCYAERSHRTFPKTIYKFDKTKLINELKKDFIIQLGDKKQGIPEIKFGKPVKILRLGKRTEPYTPFTRDHFIQTLEACEETKTRGIITNKFLPHDKIISNLTKKTNSTLLFSLCDDNSELGAVMQGFPNKVRMENAIKYKEDGCNSIIYLNVPNPVSLSEKEWKIIEQAHNHSLPVQILPLRFKRADVMRKMIGIERRIAVGHPNMFDPMAGTYIWEGRQAIPRIDSIDSKLIKMIGKNTEHQIHMCHHDDFQTFCGGCGITSGKIRSTQKVDTTRYNKGKNKKSNPERKHWDTTISLDSVEYWKG